MYILLALFFYIFLIFMKANLYISVHVILKNVILPVFNRVLKYFFAITWVFFTWGPRNIVHVLSSGSSFPESEPPCGSPTACINHEIISMFIKIKLRMKLYPNIHLQKYFWNYGTIYKIKYGYDLAIKLIKFYYY